MFIILWILPIVGIIWACLYWGKLKCTNKRGEEVDRDLPGGILGSSIVLAVALFLLTLIIPLCGISDRISLETFYYDNFQNYGTAVDKTASYLSEEEFVSSLLAGSIEKLEYAGFVADRILEWREEVTHYNRGLRSYRYWQEHFLTDILFRDVAEDLQSLVIK